MYIAQTKRSLLAAPSFRAGRSTSFKPVVLAANQECHSHLIKKGFSRHIDEITMESVVWILQVFCDIVVEWGSVPNVL
jgi:hypothetical protein